MRDKRGKDKHMSTVIQNLLVSHAAVSSAIAAYWLARNQPNPSPNPDGSTISLTGNTITVSNAPKDQTLRCMLYMYAELHGCRVTFGQAKPLETPKGVAEAIGELVAQ